MTAEVVRFPCRDLPVRSDIAGSALIIVLPIIRVERYAEKAPRKPKIRRKARRRVT